MPPPAVPRTNKRTRVNKSSVLQDNGNIPTNNGSSDTRGDDGSPVLLAGRLSHIFDAAQENEALHGKFCTELTKLYDAVRAKN